MKRNIIRIFLLAFLILLVSQVKVQAVLKERLKKDNMAWSDSTWVTWIEKSDSEVKKYDIHGEKKGVDNATKSVNVKYNDGEQSADALDSTTEITVTPKDGDDFYVGDQITLMYAIMQLREYGYYEVVDIHISNSEKSGENGSSSNVTEKRKHIANPDLSASMMTRKIIETITLKNPGKTVVVAECGVTDHSLWSWHKREVNDKIIVTIPNVKSQKEYEKKLIADSESDIAYHLRGKNYRKIVSPNLVVNGSKVNAVDSAAKQINSTFSEISSTDATKKIKFEATTEDDIKDSKGNKISIQGCKAEFIITSKKTRKVECLGVSGYIDGKPTSTSWFNKNVKERRKVQNNISF